VSHCVCAMIEYFWCGMNRHNRKFIPRKSPVSFAGKSPKVRSTFLWNVYMCLYRDTHSRFHTHNLSLSVSLSFFLPSLALKHIHTFHKNVERVCVFVLNSMRNSSTTICARVCVCVRVYVRVCSVCVYTKLHTNTYLSPGAIYNYERSIFGAGRGRRHLLNS